jgi:hypothetical protein
MLVMRAETCVGLHEKRPLLLHNFKQNWYMSITSITAPQYQSLRTCVQRFASCYMGTDGQTYGEGK